MEQYMGKQASEASPLGPPTLTGGWGRGRWGCGERGLEAEQAPGLQQNQGYIMG